ncbi:MAG: diaminopimelate epimerase [Nitrospirae bacterium]|nr:diaminopimelate epimerase [Nitrospirota bacterium]
MKLQFTKMHSLGNDFIVIDARDLKLKNLRKLAVSLCDRRFGIGADQMLLLGRSGKADYKMRVLNADGSEVQMCGNGIRCLGKYIWDEESRGQRAKGKGQNLSIETLGGTKYLRRAGKLIEVDMGEPVFEPERIPVRLSSESGVRSLEKDSKRRLSNSKLKTPNSRLLLNYPLKVKDKTFKITCVSMGNPHAVIVVRDARSAPLNEYGPLIERHGLFPERTNVEFIQIKDKRNINMRVWERGAGETMACGTGASASAVAAVLLGLSDRNVLVRLPGGKLRIRWSDKNDHVYMTGDAVTVFEGTVEI